MLSTVENKSPDIFEKETMEHIGQINGNALFEGYQIVIKDEKVFVYGEPVFNVNHPPIPSDFLYDSVFLVNLDDLQFRKESLNNRVFAEGNNILPLGNDHIAKEVVLTIDTDTEPYIVEFYKRLFEINKANSGLNVNMIVLSPEILKSHYLAGGITSISSAFEQYKSYARESVEKIKNDINEFQQLNEENKAFFPKVDYLKVENVAHPWTQDVTQQI